MHAVRVAARGEFLRVGQTVAVRIAARVRLLEVGLPVVGHAVVVEVEAVRQVDDIDVRDVVGVVVGERPPLRTGDDDPPPGAVEGAADQRGTERPHRVEVGVDDQPGGGQHVAGVGGRRQDVASPDEVVERLRSEVQRHPPQAAVGDDGGPAVGREDAGGAHAVRQVAPDPGRPIVDRCVVGPRPLGHGIALKEDAPAVGRYRRLLVEQEGRRRQRRRPRRASGLDLPQEDLRVRVLRPGDERRRLGREGHDVAVVADRRLARVQFTGGAGGGAADQDDRASRAIEPVHLEHFAGHRRRRRHQVRRFRHKADVAAVRGDRRRVAGVVGLDAARCDVQPRRRDRAGLVEDAVRVDVPITQEDVRQEVGIAVHEIRGRRGEDDVAAGAADRR